VEDNERRWYVVHTYSGYEERVKKNLDQSIKFMDTRGDISQAVVPTEQEV